MIRRCSVFSATMCAAHIRTTSSIFLAGATLSASSASGSLLGCTQPLFAPKKSSSSSASSKKSSSSSSSNGKKSSGSGTSSKSSAQKSDSTAESKSSSKQQQQQQEQQNDQKQQSEEQKQETSNTNNTTSSAIIPHGGHYYVPATGTVSSYASVALKREGRDHIIEAPIYSEDSIYPPILARGRKNVYEHTDDIPKDVKPMFGDTQVWQTREYFEYRRNAESLRYRFLYLGSGMFVFLGLAGGVAFTRIWIDQPSEVSTIRRTLLGNAYGRVLELAAGQGINIGVYPFAVTDVVLVDSNPQELHILRSRLPKTVYPTYQVVCDNSEELRAFPDHCFDTVVDMFGLCHYKDPVRVLKQMQRVCKPTGQLLLLEHGRTDYGWVNWFLDTYADSHREKTQGCQWNKDLRQIFADANLVIRSIDTQHYGTTYVVVAHPEVTQDLPLTAGGEPAQPVMKTGVEKSKSAWASPMGAAAATS